MIEDNGIGMSQEFLEHIFDPFSRADSGTGFAQGTGLGMAITKSIVDTMDGTIHIQSSPGKGSRFCIELPFEVCPEAMVPDIEKKGQISIEENGQPVLSGKHFLCAEDNELNAEILVSILELEGAECTVYENALIFCTVL